MEQRIDLDDVFSNDEKVYLYALNLKIRKYEEEQTKKTRLTRLSELIFAIPKMVYYNTLCQYLDPIAYKQYLLVCNLKKGRNYEEIK